MPNTPAPSAVVLVVEDEVLVSTPVVEQLKEENCIVFEASSGEDALGFLESDPAVDVVFTDIRLGGDIDGWKVAKAFRDRDPHVGVIYTSGYASRPPEDMPNSRFFSKPYEPAEIVSVCLALVKEKIAWPGSSAFRGENHST